MRQLVMDLVRAPVRLARFLAEAPALLQHARRSAKGVQQLERRIARLQEELRTARSDARALRKELRDRLLQYNLLLGRLSRGRAANPEADEARLSWREVPLQLDERRDMEWDGVGGGEPPPDPEGREWLTLERCPACGHDARTVVNAFNKFVVMEKAPDNTSARYDFAVCHACGIAYATRRPVGSRYRFLLRHFGEVTNKAGGSAEIRNPLLNPYPLTDADRHHLKELVSRGVWVSEHAGLRKSEYRAGTISEGRGASSAPTSTRCRSGRARSSCSARSTASRAAASSTSTSSTSRTTAPSTSSWRSTCSRTA